MADPGEKESTHMSNHVTRALYAAAAIFVVAGLYAGSRQSYLLFHSLIEVSTIAIAFALATLTWNSRRFLASGCLKAIGIGYGLIAVIDVLHTLAYKGMGVFPAQGANLPSQLWIAARALQALLLCIAPLYARRKLNEWAFVGIATAATAAATALVFGGLFPDCFVEGKGLTPFKIASEYVISAALIGALSLFICVRTAFNATVFTLVAIGILCTIGSELAFTSYISVYGPANMIGHFLKLAAFALTYRALVVTGFKEPYELIFRDLKQAEQALRRHQDTLEELVRERTAALETANSALETEVEEHKRAEEKLFRLNRELRAISSCNQVLVRAENERTLLDEICRIVCDEAYYRMAWVGYAGNDTAKNVWPVALAGMEEDYLALAGLTWADTERGGGPAGTAIRSGRTDCSRDIATDPRMALWRENALQRGYRSIIALPLKDENANVFGVFLIYSSEPNAFTPDEIRLLEELAGDLAFGIQAMHNRNARKQAEEELHLQTVGLEQEVAERQMVQEELETLNEQLEQRVGERTAELERANVRLLELDRMKSMFIASMSHELRTPLNSVIGFSRILHNEWLGPLNGEQKENLAIVLRSGKLLLSLINDIIDVSKIEADMIEAVTEDFDVYDVVSEATATFENDFRDKGIRLTVQAIHHIMQTDRTRLLQCLLNLVSNALKFTEKGTITICAEIQDGGDMLEISVADTGIGIKEEDFDKIYSPFIRLDSHLKTTVPGTGLGLYLTRKLVREVLQGDITATSAPGVGSRFVLTVPINGLRRS